MVRRGDHEGRLLRRDSSPELRLRARELRQQEKPAEVRLWEALRDRRFMRLRFRRQHALGRFIADFYCAEHNLAIEVDGGVHNEPEVQLHDVLRDRWLHERGVRIVRLPSALVLADIGQCLGLIRRAIVLPKPANETE